MHTFSATRPVTLGHTAPDGLGLGSRFFFWLAALDAGYRSAHRLAGASDARLSDMGISRRAAEAEFARHGGVADTPASGSFGAW